MNYTKDALVQGFGDMVAIGPQPGSAPAIEPPPYSTKRRLIFVNNPSDPTRTLPIKRAIRKRPEGMSARQFKKFKRKEKANEARTEDDCRAT